MDFIQKYEISFGTEIFGVLLYDITMLSTKIGET